MADRIVDMVQGPSSLLNLDNPKDKDKLKERLLEKAIENMSDYNKLKPIIDEINALDALEKPKDLAYQRDTGVLPTGVSDARMRADGGTYGLSGDASRQQLLNSLAIKPDSEYDKLAAIQNLFGGTPSRMALARESKDDLQELIDNLPDELKDYFIQKAFNVKNADNSTKRYHGLRSIFNPKMWEIDEDEDAESPYLDKMLQKFEEGLDTYNLQPEQAEKLRNKFIQEQMDKYNEQRELNNAQALKYKELANSPEAQEFLKNLRSRYNALNDRENMFTGEGKPATEVYNTSDAFNNALERGLISNREGNILSPLNDFEKAILMDITADNYNKLSKERKAEEDRALKAKGKGTPEATIEQYPGMKDTWFISSKGDAAGMRVSNKAFIMKDNSDDPTRNGMYYLVPAIRKNAANDAYDSDDPMAWLKPDTDAKRQYLAINDPYNQEVAFSNAKSKLTSMGNVFDSDDRRGVNSYASNKDAIAHVMKNYIGRDVNVLAKEWKENGVPQDIQDLFTAISNKRGKAQESGRDILYKGKLDELNSELSETDNAEDKEKLEKSIERTENSMSKSKQLSSDVLGQLNELSNFEGLNDKEAVDKVVKLMRMADMEVEKDGTVTQYKLDKTKAYLTDEDMSNMSANTKPIIAKGKLIRECKENGKRLTPDIAAQISDTQDLTDWVGFFDKKDNKWKAYNPETKDTFIQENPDTKYTTQGKMGKEITRNIKTGNEWIKNTSGSTTKKPDKEGNVVVGQTGQSNVARAQEAERKAIKKQAEDYSKDVGSTQENRNKAEEARKAKNAEDKTTPKALNKKFDKQNDRLYNEMSDGAFNERKNALKESKDKSKSGTVKFTIKPGADGLYSLGSINEED